MSWVQLLLHVLNFGLPALAMALLMPWMGRWLMGAGGWPMGRRMGLHALLGTAVLVAGLVLQGHDGKMSTYLVLVLVAASAEWTMQRGWARR
jgi:hypothetical protein